MREPASVCHCARTATPPARHVLIPPTVATYGVGFTCTGAWPAARTSITRRRVTRSDRRASEDPTRADVRRARREPPALGGPDAR
jgi:hypothetical protein